MASDPTTAGPAGDPYPALVGMLGDWLAEHSDVIHRAFIEVEPGTVWLIAQNLNDEFPGGADLIAPLCEIDCRVAQDERFAGINFRTDEARLDYNARKPILFGDPDAAAKIADRVRTADDLRAELARVRAERDVLIDLHIEPETEWIDSGTLRARERLTGRWIAIDPSNAYRSMDERFPDRESACRAVIEQARAIVTQEREEDADGEN